MSRPFRAWGATRRTCDVLMRGWKFPVGTCVTGGRKPHFYRVPRTKNDPIIGVVVELVSGGAWIRIQGSSEGLK